jgi:hypothetical protein
MAAAAVLLLLAGCTGAGDNYVPERGISADIDASHFRGATSSYPGLNGHDEPLGTYSWRIDH